MKEGTWLVHRWKMDCPACNIRVEDEAAYCPNCGKWLGVVRKHVKSFASISGLALVASVLVMMIAYAEGGSLPLSVLATVTAGVGLGMLAAIKPFGERLFWWEEKKRRAQEWNAEIAQRKQETATKQKRTAGVCNCGEGDESLVHFVWCEKAREDTKKRRFPLYAGSGFTQTKLGTIELLTENPIRAQIDEGWGSLHYFENAKGVLENFFLEPLPKPVAEEDDYTPPTSGGSLPVRNGPDLFVFFKHSHDNHDGFEDIKRNLEEVYRWKSGGIHRKLDLLTDLIPKWKVSREKCGAITEQACSDCDGYGSDLCRILEKIQLEFENRPMAFRLQDDPPREKKPITFTTLSKGLDKFTDIGCSCGRKNRVIHLRSEFTCPCGKRYVNTSEGWRPEPCCRLQFRSDACLGGTLQVPSGPCNKTIEDCRRNGNEERFAP